MIDKEKLIAWLRTSNDVGDNVCRSDARAIADMIEGGLVERWDSEAERLAREAEEAAWAAAPKSTKPITINDLSKAMSEAFDKDFHEKLNEHLNAPSLLDLFKK